MANWENLSKKTRDGITISLGVFFRKSTRKKKIEKVLDVK